MNSSAIVFSRSVHGKEDIPAIVVIVYWTVVDAILLFVMWIVAILVVWIA